MIVILRVGAGEVYAANLEVGSITAIVQYITLTVMYLTTSAMVLVTLPTTYSCFVRVRQILNTPIDIKDPEEIYPYHSHMGKLNNEPVLEFRNVSFSYTDAEEPVLTNINFNINKGETIGIVGSTGSGKTTITKLIMRFNDVSSGQIRLNGNDIRYITQNELREDISLVPQKTFLFNGTIKENLKHGNETVSEDRIKEALIVSDAFTFVNKLPEKELSPVAPGGVNFSGGQRQRLAIARALSKKASLYVFDDSFSALDFKTEKKVRKGVQNMLKDSATIIIAQRLSSIIHADRILVVDEGKIIASGKHDELIKQNKTYRDFAISQNLIDQ
jgi:ATP-binding cassette subfamily B protein